MIEVSKIDLREGEELQKVVRSIVDTLRSDDEVHKTSKELGLRGIFKDHIVTQDFTTGRMFKFDLARDEAGTIKLSNPVEVRMTFVPVEAKNADGTVTKSDEPAPKYIEAPVAKGLWAGVL